MKQPILPLALGISLDNMSSQIKYGNRATRRKTNFTSTSIPHKIDLLYSPVRLEGYIYIYA